MNCLRNILVLLVLAVLLCVSAVPAGAETVGGIDPVSPEQFAGKFTELGDIIYGAASPITDTVAKISLSLAGLLLVVMLIIGPGLIRRVIGAVFSVAVGLCLWYSAPHLVGLIKYLAAWLQA